MFKKVFRIGAILQLITAAFHSLSFISQALPSNDTEKQLIDLMKNYHRDLGLGFRPTTDDLFLAMSACFTLLCGFAGLVNFYFLKITDDRLLLKGLLNINLLIFGILFFVMATFTFFPPIVCTAMIFLAFIAAKYFEKK